MQTTLLAPHVDSHPNKCGGKPCVAGTRIRVADVSLAIEVHGMTPDGVRGLYPQLTLADVYGAMAYYWDHRDEIDRQIEEEEELADKLREQLGPDPLGS